MTRTSSQSLIAFYQCALVLAAGLLLAACSPPHQPVNLAGNNWLGYQPFYVAEELYPPTSETAEFTIHSLPSTSNLLRLMAEDQLDGGFLTVDEALTYQQGTKDDLCVAMVIDVSNGGDAVVMRAGWRQQSEPLTIAREATAVGAYMLQRALQFEVFAGRQIRTSVATLNMHANLFESGQVDGVVTFYPVLSQLTRQDTDIVFDSSMISGEIIDLLVMKASVWQQHGRHMRPHLTKLWQQAVEDIESRSAQVTRIISANTGLSATEIEAALQGIEFIGATSQQQFDLQSSVGKIHQFLIETGQLEQPQTLAYCNSGAASS